MLLLEKWRAIICSVFGKRKALRRWKQISRDIIAVAYGIKASYLFDRIYTTPEVLSSLLQRLYDEELTPIKLDLVVVDLDLIVYSRDFFLTHTEQSNSPKFVDVSCTLPEAQLIDSGKVKETSDTFSRFIDFVKVYKLSTEDGLPCLPANSWYDVDVSPDMNPSCLFGLFLGYPWIYWFDPRKGDTCLGLYSFRLYKVKARDMPRFWCQKVMPHKLENRNSDNPKPYCHIGDTVLNQGEREADCDHVLFSFTVPEHILASGNSDDVVLDWFWKWRNSTRWNELFSHVWLENVNVEMPALAL